ncbi:hypothetical protein VTL71DRAFT_3525 [Oculimacula yallundae]|uniref:N-acetyltransferase domain-containing protein n=1 Tax=Oculimacula yallundae TaxID=86028 RepID=A0ABR4C7G1_9HELO
MPSSTFEQPPAIAPIKGHARVRADIDLIAWDPDSAEHVERLYQQQAAGMWNSGDVEKWRGLQREGKLAIQWVNNTPPNAPLRAYQYTTLLSLLAPDLVNQPHVHLHPSVGHISLDSASPNEVQADPSKGLYCVTTLCISRAIQSGGLGRAAIEKIESQAVNEPINTKVLSLDTLANSSHGGQDLWRQLNMEVPPIANQDWHERRGYKPWKFVDGHVKQIINGKTTEQDKEVITILVSWNRDMGQLLDVPEREDDQAKLEELVKARLSQQSAGKWLLPILDTADAFEIFYRSEQDSGSSALSEINPVATTWLISFDNFEQIRIRNSLAAVYVAVISCIKEQDTTKSLLPPAFELKKKEALGILKAFRLSQDRLSGNSCDMH